MNIGVDRKNITTFPNQKLVYINKPKYESMYLSVGIDEWVEASENLAPNTFKVYLYLCSNKNGYPLALSRQAVKNLLGISGDSYKRAIRELTDKGYITFSHGNVYNFYTVPVVSTMGAEMQSGATVQPVWVQECTYNGGKDAHIMGAPAPIEISNISTINKLSNSGAETSSSPLGADAPVATPPTEKKERKRTLEELSTDELESLLKDFEAEVRYKDLYSKYNLVKKQLDKTLSNKINNILSERKQEEHTEEIRQQLKEETKDKTKLMSLMNVKEEELAKYLSALKVNPSIDELVDFLENREEGCIFKYDEWDKKYRHDGFDYFEWFVNGVDNNYKVPAWLRFK